MAAIASGRAGVPATVLERNPRLGTKILLSGGGRCNLTNAGGSAGQQADLAAAYRGTYRSGHRGTYHGGGGGKFLYSALARFGSDDLRALLTEEGVRTQVEDRGRVFPTSGGGKAVVAALERAARKAGATIATGVRVEEVRLEDGADAAADATAGAAASASADDAREPSPCFLVTSSDGRTWRAARLILATGGVSYPATGTTGDGYRWAREMGHTVSPLRPALVGLVTRETWPRRVSGVTLRDVTVRVEAGGRVWDECQNDVLFTHFGLSGPAVLNVSGQAVAALEEMSADQSAGAGARGSRGVAAAEARADAARAVTVSILLDPSLPVSAWRERLDERIRTSPRQMVKNLFEGWWPTSLAEVLCVEALSSEAPGTGAWDARLGVTPETQAAQLPRAARDRLAAALRELRLTVDRPRPIEEAMVTAGGVSLREVDPRTMESRLVPGLYLTGELLDIDGPTGGYNLQAAFSTGWLAGESAAKALSP